MRQSVPVSTDIFRDGTCYSTQIISVTSAEQPQDEDVQPPGQFHLTAESADRTLHDYNDYGVGTLALFRTSPQQEYLSTCSSNVKNIYVQQPARLFIS